ncbi:MAG: helix-turn-helix domain-containing protein [Candidatus Micrarchaeota archaeon]
MAVEEKALLQELGLTGNEAQIYLSLCSLGPANASGIAEKSGVNRTLVYDTLKRLLEKGFVSEVDLDKKKLFKAAEPGRLRALVEERQKLALDGVERLIPALQERYVSTRRPMANTYTGLEGLKTVFTQEIDELPEGGVLKVYRVQPGVAIASPIFMSWWNKKRIAKKITLKGIVDSSPAALKRGKELAKMPFTEIRFLKEPLPSPVTYQVFGEKASIMAMAEEESLGIVIESRIVAKSLEENFDCTWEALGKKK